MWKYKVNVDLNCVLGGIAAGVLFHNFWAGILGMSVIAALGKSE